MGLTFVLSVAAILVLGLAGFAYWLVRQPLPEVVISEEAWEVLGHSDYMAWSEANPREGWIMAARRDDGDYALSFMSRGAARRFSQRWLRDVPNQASLTHSSRSGTGSDQR